MRCFQATVVGKYPRPIIGLPEKPGLAKSSSRMIEECFVTDLYALAKKGMKN